jgi:anaerobic ribonucleoside-triphosphate reductase activating protein
MTSAATLSVALIVPATEAEGPGRRFALWLQGCPLRCPGCCNPEMLAFEGGRQLSVTEVVDQVLAARENENIEGITLLGGEPFAQAAASAELAEILHSHDLSVMIFSGFTLPELRAQEDQNIVKLLAAADILVDGSYLSDQPESRRRWIGSANQQIYFLSDRYQADDPRWLLPNTLEIRLTEGELTVNGFPSRSTKDFWKRLPQRARS